MDDLSWESIYIFSSVPIYSKLFLNIRWSNLADASNIKHNIHALCHSWLSSHSKQYEPEIAATYWRLYRGIWLLCLRLHRFISRFYRSIPNVFWYMWRHDIRSANEYCLVILPRQRRFDNWNHWFFIWNGRGNVWTSDEQNDKSRTYWGLGREWNAPLSIWRKYSLEFAWESKSSSYYMGCHRDVSSIHDEATSNSNNSSTAYWQIISCSSQASKWRHWREWSSKSIRWLTRRSET